jgi:hypothetical protein
LYGEEIVVKLVIFLQGSGGSGGTTDSFSGTGCNDDDEDCSGESSGVGSSMFFFIVLPLIQGRSNQGYEPMRM